MLADEPTGNLDSKTGTEIMALFERINGQGTTVLVATHDRNLIQRMKKRVISVASATTAPWSSTTARSAISPSISS